MNTMHMELGDKNKHIFNAGWPLFGFKILLPDSLCFVREFKENNFKREL